MDWSEETWAPKISRLIGFGTSAAIWLVISDAFGFPFATSLVPPMALAIFLFAGTAFVGLSEAWFGVLVGLWVLAVGAFATYALSSDEPLPIYGVILPIVFSLIYVTIPFVGWVATAGAMWTLLEGRPNRHE